jgi:tetratricopeptide (TPR) repeat protein
MGNLPLMRASEPRDPVIAAFLDRWELFIGDWRARYVEALRTWESQCDEYRTRVESAFELLRACALERAASGEFDKTRAAITGAIERTDDRIGEEIGRLQSPDSVAIEERSAIRRNLARMDQRSYTLLADLADIHTLAFEPDRAVEVYREMLTRNEDDDRQADTRGRLAMALARAGHRDEATVEWKRVADEFKQASGGIPAIVARYLMGEVTTPQFMESARQKHRVPEETCEMICGQRSELEGKWREALAHYERVVAITPELRWPGPFARRLVIYVNSKLAGGGESP